MPMSAALALTVWLPHSKYLLHHPGGELLLPASSAPHAQTEASGL